MAESDEPFDRWHKRYPKNGDVRCTCGTKRYPLFKSADHGRGQRWQARYTDPDGKPRRASFDDWEEARDHLEEVRVAMRKGTWTDPDLGAERTVHYAQEFVAHRRRNGKHENTTKTYENNLRKHVVPFLGHRVAKTLKRRDTKLFMNHLLTLGLAPITVHNIFSAWSILVHYMVDEEDVPLPANLVSRITLPEVSDRVDAALTADQVNTLAAAMRLVEPRFEVLVWIGACAGLRAGEARGLTRDCVDWENHRIFVVAQRQDGKVAKLKTKASKATLTVDPFLIRKLREHMSRFTQWEPVRPSAERERRKRGWTPPPDEGLIVTNRLGRPILDTDFGDKWNAAVELAGLPPATRFHDLKHFYTTHLGGSGDHDPKTVQALSRHSRFSVTWDTYAHPPQAVDSSVKVRAFGRVFTPDGSPQAEPEPVRYRG